VKVMPRDERRVRDAMAAAQAEGLDEPAVFERVMAATRI